MFRPPFPGGVPIDLGVLERIVTFPYNGFRQEKGSR